MLNLIIQGINVDLAPERNSYHIYSTNSNQIGMVIRYLEDEGFFELFKSIKEQEIHDTLEDNEGEDWKG